MLVEAKQLTAEELEAGIEAIQESPRDDGELVLISRRPEVNAREHLTVGQLDTTQGLVGDSWSARPSSRTPDRSPHPDMQLTLMNTRVIELIAQLPERWDLAGDQLFVDLDLSVENLPVGTLLEIGSARIEVTAQPHTGCQKFSDRFGVDALKFVMTPAGREMRLRGMNAKVVQSGEIRVGDRVKKV